MAAGDLNWTDAGRTSEAQFFYPLSQRKRNGRCSDNEVRTSLMVRRLYRMWTRLFEMVHKRLPNLSEINEAISTHSMGRDVLCWESVELAEPDEREIENRKRIDKNLRRQNKVVREHLRKREALRLANELEKKEQDEYEKSLVVEFNPLARAAPKKRSESKRKPAKRKIEEDISKDKLSQLIEKGFSPEIICMAVGINDSKYRNLMTKYKLS